MKWRSIETAPKDMEILLFFPQRGVVCGRWEEDKYARSPRPYWSNDRERIFGTRETRQDQPTYWMELPAPPTNVKEINEERKRKGPVDVNVMRFMADMAQATAWLNFTASQANHDLQRYGEWRCDYETQASVFQRDFEKAERELMAATHALSKERA